MDKPDNEIPNLDEIISQITNNGEFNDMMSQISNEVNKKDINPNIQDDETESELNSNDLLTSLFTDSDGNNICEILSNINNNLQKIANNLNKK